MLPLLGRPLIGLLMVRLLIVMHGALSSGVLVRDNVLQLFLGLSELLLGVSVVDGVLMGVRVLGHAR